MTVIITIAMDSHKVEFSNENKKMILCSIFLKDNIKNNGVKFKGKLRNKKKKCLKIMAFITDQESIFSFSCCEKMR